MIQEGRIHSADQRPMGAAHFGGCEWAVNDTSSFGQPGLSRIPVSLLDGLESNYSALLYLVYNDCPIKPPVNRKAQAVV